MQSRMNSEQLSAIKERAEKATPGPWYFDKGVKERGDRRPAVIEYFDYDHGETFIHGDISNIDDAEFIAHAREDIPQLVAEIERLQAKEDFADYAIRQNKALWEALTKACASLGANTLDYYEEEGGI